MSTVIVVDSACDLPERVTNSGAIEVLPLNLMIGDSFSRDRYSAGDRLEMLRNGTLDLKHDVDTAPASRDQIVEFLTQQIVPNYDFAMVQTVARARSPQHEMWMEVHQSFAAHYREYRKRDNSFILRVVDSGTFFTGQGLMALNAVRLGQKKVSHRDLLNQSRQLVDKVQSYSAPVDVHYLRERARRKGDRTISLFNAMLGKALNIAPVIYGGQNKTEPVGQLKGHENAVNAIIGHAMACIESGLQVPLITIAYGGPLGELERFSALDELKWLAEKKGVKIATSVATIGSIINMGPGTFSLGVAPQDPTLKLSIEK